MTALYIILAVLAVLIIFTAIKAAMFVPKKTAELSGEKEKVDSERVQKHLTMAIQCRTVSRDNPDEVNWGEFERFHKFLEEEYPLVHKTCSKEIIDRASLVYIWKGKNSALKPMALIAHQDVVPVTEGTEKDWEHDPFDGYNDGENIWGRGSIDMKNHLICVMEAVEDLIAEGYVPERDVYMCFGHNEEIMCSPASGAQAVVRTLKERGIEFESVIDEGGAILTADVKGLMNTYVTGIGVAEKGYCDFKVTVTDKGGHTSQAPDHNGLYKLANVIRDLENNQFKAKVLPYVDELIDGVGRTGTYLGRFLLCNYKALKPLIKFVMMKIPAGACLVRTVTGVTMCEGSHSPNVLPQKASVTANFRPIYGETIDDVEKHIKDVVRYKDAQVEFLKGRNPSRFSSTSSRNFKAIEKSVASFLTDRKVAVVPYLVMGGTDAYFYEDICENVLRFSPFKLSVETLRTTHGTNEHCPIKALEEGVAFFKSYVRILAKED